MRRVLATSEGAAHVPIHVWARVVPDGALEQLRRIASQPYVVEHVAAMPDLHVAHGVAVGTVFATEDTIVPSALGGDIGCGMSALRFPFPASALSRSDRQSVLERLASLIPVGDAVHRGKGVRVPDALLSLAALSTRALEHARERLVPRHLQTLGGGNHFVELDRDSSGDLWILVHSGSRGMGAAIGAHHLRAAEAGGRGDIPGLPLDSEAGQACLRDIDWALRFARANRDAILHATAGIIEDATGSPPDPLSRLDVHHNFVRLEEHFGRKLWIHRKGAIAAPAEERALIPGSMGTASYLVMGRGEPLSFKSGSHGAGRVMTRREARENIKPARFQQSMRRVIYDELRSRALLEEAPFAYRDIVEVLEDEADLVTPLIRLEPIVVLKG
jgi:tRNA-splicing ligase RtcB (3'-phosphate/5'-hydroxy nucleic acid ligase)